MELNYSAEIPVRMVLKGARRQLNYDVRELGEDELKALWENEGVEVPYEYFAKEHKYSYRSLEMGGARWNYSGIVEAIIRDKYSIDEMEAINNNMAAINAVYLQTLVTDGIVEAIRYLKESADASDSETFREMQEWRALAKKEAKNILKMD